MARLMGSLLSAWLALLAPPLAVGNAQAAECGVPAAGNDDWQVATQASVGFDPALLCALVQKLESSPQDNVHGVVVARAGRLVFETYLDGSDERWGAPLGPTVHGPDVRHDVRSVSKSVTSLLVGIAIDRKLIASVDEPLLAYFPQYGVSDQILLRHVLSMTSGIAWDESRPYSDPRNSEIRMIRSPDPYRFVLEQPMSSTPGKVWNYSGGSTQLLAGIVQRVTGRPFLDFAREALFEALGIVDFEWVTMSNGETAAASGLRLRPRDMARIGQLLLNGGEWDGRRIVSADWLRKSTLPGVSSTYGYQWWTGLSVLGEQVIERTEAKGWGGQRIFILPSADLVVVVTAGLYVKRGIDNEGEITNDILDSYVLPALADLAHVASP